MSIDQQPDDFPGRPFQTPAAETLIRGLGALAALAQSGTAGRELRERIVTQARDTFGAHGVALWRLESRDRIWRIAAASGLSEGFASIAIPVMEAPDSAAVLAAPLFIEDVRAWPMVDPRRGLYDEEGIASFLVLPLRIRGETAGTICCYYETPRGKLSDAEMAAAAAFADIASVAL